MKDDGKARKFYENAQADGILALQISTDRSFDELDAEEQEVFRLLAKMTRDCECADCQTPAPPKVLS